MALLPVADALAQVLDGAPLTQLETVDLLAARDRILATPLAAGHDQPPFDASAMDGYAVRQADIARLPATLTICGEAAAGRGFRGVVTAGQAVRIFTGAPLPDGADRVVIQENTRRNGDQVEVLEAGSDGTHVRRRAFDFARGDVLLQPPQKLTARALTLAAAMGHARLPVRRKPIVAIIATGDELVLPGTAAGIDQIVCSNPFGIAAMVAQAGGEPRFLGIARDTRDDIGQKLDAAAGANIIVTIGGASVGDHDLVAPVLQARGVPLDFWKIAMRPGKPLMFARHGDQRILGLPGNPVSSLICTRVFVIPLIWAMLGLAGEQVAPFSAVAEVDLELNGPRTHYARAILRTDQDGTSLVRPVHSQDSSLLSPLAAADCLIVRPPNDPARSAGSRVDYLRLDF